jgi:hypothetical protein
MFDDYRSCTIYKIIDEWMDGWMDGWKSLSWGSFVMSNLKFMGGDSGNLAILPDNQGQTRALAFGDHLLNSRL